MVANCCQACHCSGSNSSTRGARLARSRALGGAITPKQVDGNGGNGRDDGNLNGNHGNVPMMPIMAMMLMIKEGQGLQATGSLSLLAAEDDCEEVILVN